MEQKIIPFGKYKNQSIDAMAQDKEYMDWLVKQGWLAEKYPQINTLIINNFAEPSETPAHNKIQGLFLNDEFRVKLIKHFLLSLSEKSNTPFEEFKAYKSSLLAFEVNAVDVQFHVECFNDKPLKSSMFQSDLEIKENGFYYAKHFSLRIEIKTSVGDDYPAILRQIRSLIGFKGGGQFNAKDYSILLTKEYTGVGISESDFVKLFASQNIFVLFLNDIK